jgi:hypothetical protein
VYNVISAIGAVGSVAAAAAAWAAALATKRAAQGQLLARFLDQYGTEDMKGHLRTLRAIGDTATQGFAKAWLVALQARDTEAKVADAARRSLTTFYSTAEQLQKARALDGARFKVLANLPGAELLLRVVEPMEAQLDPGYDRSAFDAVRTARSVRPTRLRSIPP